ncbi:MAG: hypothetical protein LBV22_00575 [Mycoplasmataceae bacterium]|jgi:hypothetical protein|nr:hypothetical protein [Mycoplasmataceae bacterium]
MAIHNISSMVAKNENFTHVAHTHQIHKNFYVSFFLLFVAAILVIFCKLQTIPFIDFVLDDNTLQTLFLLAILAATFGGVILVLTIIILIFKFLFHSTNRIYATPVYEASRFAKDPYQIESTENAFAPAVDALPLSSSNSIKIPQLGTVHSVPFDPSATVASQTGKKHHTTKIITK